MYLFPSVLFECFVLFECVCVVESRNIHYVPPRSDPVASRVGSDVVVLLLLLLDL